MFAGFLLILLLLLFTGGSSSNHTEPPDAEGVYNQSHLERGSSSNHTEPDDQLTGTMIKEGVSVRSSSNHTEPDDQFTETGEIISNYMKAPIYFGWLSWDDEDDNNDYDFKNWYTNEGGALSSLDGERDREQVTDGVREDTAKQGDLPTHCHHTNMVKGFNILDKVKFYLTRPTKNSLRPTNVTLRIYLYSILDVKENEQELISYFWIDMYWKNEFIKWELDDFCMVEEIPLPSEMLWKPDITIEEVTKKDKLFKTPYLTVRHDGDTFQRNGVVLVSTCLMQYYRFPFDTQTCSLTFRSIQHRARQIELFSRWTNEDILNRSRKWMKTESEWLLLNITVETEKVFSFAFPLSVLVYTMTIKRSSVLYVINFIVPILFFLCLDLASFLISESGGEKLSFKVTVMLAVTVMQLILNEIIPSSDRIPLIAVYCIGVFTLMMLSLLETILMMYLMEKDHVSQDKEAGKDQSLGEDCRDQPGRDQTCFRDMNKSIPCVRVFDGSAAETPPELLPEVKEVKEGSSSQLTEETMDFERLSHELREVSKKMSLLLSSRKEEKEPGYWTRMTKKLNWIYFIFYLITTSVFLGWVFSVWLS